VSLVTVVARQGKDYTHHRVPYAVASDGIRAYRAWAYH